MRISILYSFLLHFRKTALLLILGMVIFCGCANDSASKKAIEGTANATNEKTTENIDEIMDTSLENETILEGDNQMSQTHIEPIKGVKNPTEHNPVMTQKYSADPYAMVYDGRVYLYMTGDEPMYEADGSLKTNNYSNINTIRVISSEDLVNWTDHGEVYAAGKDGASTWGNNSWAPAACWKNIDGKPKFFLYFANSGNGIAVLTSDSPTGPFIDPIGEALVSRNTKTCAEVTWLFDPAVLVDDDGTGYLYFGGGVPSPEQASNPGTARVARLTDDMIHLDSDPVPIENVLYLFEDSGINKVGDKYIYSYCSNFNVPDSGCEGYGFGNGEIITMVGDNPMGPFKTVRSILKNPSAFFKNGGNNHHCMFEFEGKWYVTYHASLIEEKLGLASGYRSVNIDNITIGEDGVFDVARGTKEGVSQLKNFDPYKNTLFTTMASQAGIKTVAADENTLKYGSGNLNLKIVESGSYIMLSGVDFKDGASLLKVNLKGNTKGSISVRVKYVNGEDLGKLVFEGKDEFSEYELKFDTPITGVQDLFFVFEGEGYELKDWKFEK